MAAPSPQEHAFKRFYKRLGKVVTTPVKYVVKQEAGAYWSRRSQRKAPRAPQQESGYRKGMGKELGRWRARERRVRNPIGSVFLVLILYLFFSLGPFAFLPPLGFMTLAWGCLILYFILARSYLWAVIFIILFPLLNFGLAQDFFQEGQIISEEWRSKLRIRDLSEVVKSSVYKSFGEWKNPKAVEKIEKKGLVFTRFIADDYFAQGERVSLTATVRIDGHFNPNTQTYEQMLVTFSCYEQDKDGKIITRGTIFTESSPKPEENKAITVLGREVSQYDVACLFADGLTLDESETVLFIGGQTEGIITENRQVAKKRVVMEAKIKFSQISFVELWTILDANIPKDEPELLFATVKDPNIIIREGQVRTRPRCTYGCGGPYGLAVTTGVQPATEKTKPILEVELLKNPNIFGILTHIYGITISPPDGLTFLDAPLDCAFDGNSVADEKLLAINTRLAASEARLRTSAEAQPPLIKFKCNYQITNPPSTLSFKTVEARAVYDMIVRKPTLVEIYKDIDTLAPNNDLT